MPRSKALAKPEPQSGLDVVRDCRKLTEDERKRLAARACQTSDEPVLWCLVEAYVRLFGRKGANVSSNTLAAYRRGLAVLLEWVDGPENVRGNKVHRLTREDASAFRQWLGTEKAAGGAGLSPASCNARLRDARVIYEALTWAYYGEGTLDEPTRRPRNPFEKVSVIDPTRPEDKRQAYSAEELDALLAVADPRERVLVLLGADGGLRVSELAALQWQSVDTTRRELTVIAGKGGKTRKVRVSPRLCEALAALHALDKPTKAQPVLTRRPCPSLRRSTAKPLVRQRLGHVLRALCERAGVAHRGVHALRHAAGTRLYQATGDLKAVARHLGHASVSTSAVYAHLADSEYEAAVDRLGEGTRAA